MIVRELGNHGNPEKEGRGSLDAKLLAYCAVAGGALLASQPAQAAVVYSGIKNLALSDNKTIGVDLDADGTVDFSFLNLGGKSTFSTQNRLRLQSTSKTYTYTNYRNFQSNIIGLGAHPENAIAHKGAVGGQLDPARVVLGKGDAIPAESMAWLAGGRLDRLALSNHGSTRVVYKDKAVYPTVSSTQYAYKIGGAFAGKQGYLGLRFQIDAATHYGWIRYSGDSVTAADNGTVLRGAILDWAYEDRPYEPVYIESEPPAQACILALTPGSISKALSLISPVTGIIIRGNESAAFTGKTEIDWGSDTVKTLFTLRLSKRTMLALVRVSPLLLQGQDTYTVTVGDCSGSLQVRPF